MAVFKTRSELRLEELEALRRPLTKAESNELKRVLHAIYMRHWRLERNLMGAGGDLVEAQKQGRVETNAIAYRMENAIDPDWPLPRANDWMDHARIASDMLRDAILRAQAREAVAA
jgi:hypothetical protein